jgi:DNA-binding protein YbaB
MLEKETKKSEMLKEIFSKSLKEASKKIKEEENESRDSIWFTDVETIIISYSYRNSYR